MQVATATASSITLGTRPAKTAAVQPRTINPGIESALNLIASSTSLSPAEKQSFIQDLADITKFGGNDPKLIMKLLEAIMALIASRPAGIYPQSKLADVEAQYWADVGTTAPTQSTAASTAGTNLLA